MGVTVLPMGGRNFQDPVIEPFCGQATELNAFVCLGPLLQIAILQDRICYHI